MKKEKAIGITIGKVVQKNAPLKYAEIIEGLSSEGEDEKETVYVATVVPQSAQFFDFTVFETIEERDRMIEKYIQKRNRAMPERVEELKPPVELNIKKEMSKISEKQEEDVESPDP